MRYVLLCLALLGCGHQKAIESAATHIANLSLVQTDAARLAFYEARDEKCRDEHPPESSLYGDWRECMDPAFNLKTAVDVADASFRALDHALEAGSEASVKDALEPALAAAGDLVRGLTAAGLPIPPEVGEWLTKLRSLARIFL